MGKSYLVEGARLRCLCGSKYGRLKVTDHGDYADGKRKANCKDCLPDVNIPDFGMCKRNKDGKVCKGFMKLADSWVSAGDSDSPETLNGHAALTMDSVLLCKKGGIIVPETSGQGTVRAINWAAYTRRYRMNLSLSTFGVKSGCMFGGDPVNLNTGNFLYEKEDLVVPGATRMSFHVFYNSMDGYRGTLGKGWRHNYEIQVREEGGTSAILHLGDGRRIMFRRSLGDVYTPVSGGTGLLRKEPEGYRYAAGGSVYVFGRDGLVRSVTDRSGNTDTFVYNQQGQLEEARGANGGVLHYYHNREGNLYRVCDHTGREVRLSYSYGLLRKFRTSMGHVYAYGYNENSRLESVTTPRGIEGVKNSYDSADRVVRQVMPDGGVMDFSYDDEGMRTYTRDADGRVVSYESDDGFRNTRTVYGDSEERFGYDGNGRLVLHVDRNGNRTRYRYDGKGNLAGIRDALGNETVFAYDDGNRLIRKTLPGGGCVRNTYDGRGNLTEREDACGNVTRIAYNDRNRPVEIRQPDGSRIGITYDGRGNITGITDAAGSRTAYEYDALNRMSAVVDGNGNRTEYFHNERNDVVRVVNAAGQECRYEYSPSGKVVQITDFDGTTRKMWYDSCNRPKRYENQEGHSAEYMWDRAGHLVSEKLPNGAETGYIYDGNGRLAEYRDPVGGGVKFSYDANGNRIRTENAAGAGRVYEYDALNRLSAQTHEDGNRTEYGYDADGNLSAVTDALGNRTCMEYDGAGRKTRETDALGNTWSYTYNGFGQPVCVEDGAGRCVRYGYYPGGLLRQAEFPDGRKTFYAYDGNGNVKEKWNERGYRLYYGYDCLGRLVSVRDSEGSLVSYSRDGAGNVSAFTDADGNTTKYRYSPSGNLAEVEDALGAVTRYAYDALGDLTAVFRTGNAEEREMAFEEAVRLNREQHRFRITLYGRDPAGRITSVTDAMGNTETYAYDTEGRVVRKRDRDGNTTGFSYTPGGRLERAVYADGRLAEYSYGPLGRLEEARDWLGTATMDYDGYGRLVKRTDHRGKCTAYEWGGMNERKAVVYPDGSRVEYGYDGLMRLAEVKSGGLRVQYHYGADGKPDERTCGGTVSRFLYDGKGRLESLTHECHGTLLESCRYGYSPGGNKTETVRFRQGLPGECGTYRYRYDREGQLTGVEKDGKTLREYEYDPFHNRTAMTEGGQRTEYAHNVLDQTVWSDGAVHRVYRYDGRGNLTGVLADGKEEKTYRYDATGRLGTAEDAVAGRCSYVYNGIGERVAADMHMAGKDVRTEYHTDIMGDRHNLLMREQGETCQKYLWGRNLEGMEEDGNGTGALLDEMGSPLRFLWGNGRERFRYGYGEFGQDLYGNAGEGQPFGYTGYQVDGISGTCYAQAREYLPEHGRFCGPDIRKGHAGVPVTLNGYIYCRNSALNFLDVLGTEEESTDEEVSNEPWWVILRWGTDADKTLKEYLEDKYPKEFKNYVLGTSVYIPVGFKSSNPYHHTKTGKGFADIIYYNEEESTIEVYELKRDSVYGHATGFKQLSGYIWGIKYFMGTPYWGNPDYKFWRNKEKGVKVSVGKSINDYMEVELPSLKYKYSDGSPKIIEYRMYPDTPGVIYWKYIEEKKDPGNLTVLKERAEKMKERDPSEIPVIYKEETDIAAAVLEAIKSGVMVSILSADDIFGMVGDDVLIGTELIKLRRVVKIIYDCVTTL